MLIATLNANVEVDQNIKALYKNVNLTDKQKDYILDNQDENIEILQKILNKEIKKLKLDHLKEKNIISFYINKNLQVTKFKFLKKSNNRKLDKVIKKAIKKQSKKFIPTKEKILMRFIISYKIGQNQESSHYNNSSSNNSKEIYYQNIPRGTTRFQHLSKEYVRIFETTKDGFINLNTEPKQCMKRITLLTEKGKNITTSYAYMLGINKEVFKGKFKLLFQTKTKCNVNLQYP